MVLEVVGVLQQQLLTLAAVLPDAELGMVVGIVQ